MFETPVLLIAFNRPDLFSELVDLLRKIAPHNVYIAIDGPRKDNIGDATKVNETVRLIENIDWKCKIKVLKRETNLGCGLAVSSAISWVMETESEVIILEDDVRPNDTFFTFCAKALVHYKDDENIMSIGGHSTIEIPNSLKIFRISQYPEIWGWATWRRSWKLYEYSIGNLPQLRLVDLVKIYRGNLLLTAQSWLNFRAVKNHHLDTWDFQFFYSSLLHHKFHIIPNCNLTANLGFNEQATHTKFLPKASPEPKEMIEIKFDFNSKINQKYERKSRAFMQKQLFRSARAFASMHLRKIVRSILKPHKISIVFKD